jgi:hypothetical protein
MSALRVNSGTANNISGMDKGGCCRKRHQNALCEGVRRLPDSRFMGRPQDLTSKTGGRTAALGAVLYDMAGISARARLLSRRIVSSGPTAIYPAISSPALA